MLAMIALLFALGFCPGPKSYHYCVGDNKSTHTNTHTKGEEYRVENCWGQQHSGCCNGGWEMLGPIEM